MHGSSLRCVLSTASSVDMSAPDEQHKRITRTHWTRNIRVRACECLFSVTKDIPSLKAAIRSGTFRLVPVKDTHGEPHHPAQEAYQLFFEDPLPTRADRKLAQNLDLKKFYAILSKWAPGWFRGDNKECAEIHVHQDGLTKKEERELCSFLKKPVTLRRKLHYWRSIDDALDQHPDRARIQELVAKSRLSLTTLKRHLLKCDPDLHFGVIDKRDPLAPSTERAHTKCAAQWRGDEHWLWMLPGQLGEPVAEVKLPRGKDGRLDPRLYYEDWREPWLEFDHLTFEFDAYKLSTARGHRDLGEKGFYGTDHIYPPEIGRPAGKATDAIELQWYLIICKQLGVVGVSLSYHGSTPTLSGKKRKRAAMEDEDGPEKHDPDFKHWCVSCLTAWRFQ